MLGPDRGRACARWLNRRTIDPKAGCLLYFKRHDVASDIATLNEKQCVLYVSGFAEHSRHVRPRPTAASITHGHTIGRATKQQLRPSRPSDRNSAPHFINNGLAVCISHAPVRRPRDALSNGNSLCTRGLFVHAATTAVISLSTTHRATRAHSFAWQQ